MTYSKVFITNLPSFYKLNLYNAIAEKDVYHRILNTYRLD